VLKKEAQKTRLAEEAIEIPRGETFSERSRTVTSSDSPCFPPFSAFGFKESDGPCPFLRDHDCSP
jgi:hypothetical protein